MNSPHFNPDECAFEVHGYFEEFIEREHPHRVLGWRRIETATRKLGFAGRIEVDLIENLTLTKGLKQVLIKASPKKPVRVWTMIQVVCGAVKQPTKK